MAKARGLGRGLDSLIPAAPAAATDAAGREENGVWELPIDRITASRWQPRRDFDPEKLQELARSIESHGLINPLVVRQREDGGYELIAGERRLRALRDILRRDRAPVRLMRAEDAAMRELALVENLQRDDLNPIEEAAAYHELKKELGLTHEAIAALLQVSRPKSTYTLRLLELPEEVRQMVLDGTLAAGTARALLSLSNPMAQIKLARRAAAEGLSTRRVEQLAAEMQKEKPRPAEQRRPAHVEDLEDRLRRHFGSKVTVADDNGRGRIVIEYYSVAEAQQVLDRMGLPPA
ncbi:MAG: ParB/RepB/Spo0J family partition protein [Planctomycetes bacterium]|nr:ParB/RepB/Spo0J family partition protein [Planctomycetota bacterium]